MVSKLIAYLPVKAHIIFMLIASQLIVMSFLLIASHPKATMVFSLIASHLKATIVFPLIALQLKASHGFLANSIATKSSHDFCANSIATRLRSGLHCGPILPPGSSTMSMDSPRNVGSMLPHILLSVIAKFAN